MIRFRTSAAFTLVELLISTAVIVGILALLMTLTGQTQRLVQGTSGKVEQFREARTAFDAMTRRLSQATLNTYWDYRYRTTQQVIAGKLTPVKVPDRYERAAELRFRSGPMAALTGGIGPGDALQLTHGVFFQAPSGQVEDASRLGALDHLLNTWGYFIELGDDRHLRPAFLNKVLTERRRFRLYEFTEPTERLAVYAAQEGRSVDWFAPSLKRLPRPARVMAENVVALLILPRLSLADEELWMKTTGGKQRPVLAPQYQYDSTAFAKDSVLNPRHQLPPYVQVAMVAIDEASAQKLAEKHAAKTFLGLSYDGLFTDPLKLEDDSATPAPGDGDLAALEKQLNTLGVSYRVFTTNVAIRGAKWSRSQEN